MQNQNDHGILIWNKTQFVQTSKMVMVPLIEIKELVQNSKRTVLSLIENGQTERKVQNDFGILKFKMTLVSLTAGH